MYNKEKEVKMSRLARFIFFTEDDLLRCKDPLRQNELQNDLKKARIDMQRLKTGRAY